jgi:hypothetical protein
MTLWLSFSSLPGSVIDISIWVIALETILRVTVGWLCKVPFIDPDFS